MGNRTIESDSIVQLIVTLQTIGIIGCLIAVIIIEAKQVIGTENQKRDPFTALILFTAFYIVSRVFMWRVRWSGIFFGQPTPTPPPQPNLRPQRQRQAPPDYVKQIEQLERQILKFPKGKQALYDRLAENCDRDRFFCPVSLELKKDPTRGRPGGGTYQHEVAERLLRSPVTRIPWTTPLVRSPNQAGFIKKNLEQILEGLRAEAQQQTKTQVGIQMRPARYSSVPLQSPK